MKNLNRGATLLLSTILAVLTHSAGPAAAAPPEELTILGLGRLRSSRLPAVPTDVRSRRSA